MNTKKYLNSAQRLAGGREIMLTLIDFSPSMDETDYSPSRRQGAVEANRQLIEAKAGRFADDRIGVIAFSGSADWLHRPVSVGEGREALSRSLQGNPSVGCGTDFCAALKLAEKGFQNGPANPPSKGFLRRLVGELLLDEPKSGAPPKVSDTFTRRVVLLTDGEHNGSGDPLKIADRLKDAGVVIECVGIAGSPVDVDEKLLKRIASLDEAGEPRYCFIGDTSSLIRKYRSMANQIRAI